MSESKGGCGLPGFFAVVGALAGAGLASNAGGGDDQIMGGLIGGAVLGLVVCGLTLATIDLAKKLIAITVSLVIGCLSLLIWTRRIATIAEVISQEPTQTPIEAPSNYIIPFEAPSNYTIPFEAPSNYATPIEAPSNYGVQPEVRDFLFVNSCHEGLKLLLRYKRTDNEWVTGGWWTFEPQERSYLLDNGVRVRSSNSIFYYYAQIPGRDYEWSGDEHRLFELRTYPMRKAELSPDTNGDWNLNLPCDNLNNLTRAATQPTPVRNFYFRNTCKENLQLLVRYKRPDSQWVTVGWSSITGSQGSYLFDNGENLRSANSIFYWYAYIPARDYVWAGDEVRSFQGRTYAMRKADLSPDSDGDWLLEANCLNLN